MAFSVRQARTDDLGVITPWTRDTFDWGDYVPDRLPGWMADEDSQVLVCADEDDNPMAVLHVLMLSPREGWLEGARVHPDHRRSGMGAALNRAGVEWARKRGARVVRLAVEEDNLPARRQVEMLGYRLSCKWVFAETGVGNQPASPSGLRLRPAPAPDVDPAWMFWSTSELYHSGKGLSANGWRWRKATPEDLIDAAQEGRFYQSPAGWVVVGPLVESKLRVDWIATTHHEAPRLLESLIDLAARSNTEAMTAFLPATPWTAEALTRAGADQKTILGYHLAVS